MQRIALLVVCSFLFGCYALLPPTQAQDKPFILPAAVPASASTWLLGQPYGNTIGAYLRGEDWYSAGQRLHFGIDLSMPCGTPIIAIGTGDVLFVDDLGFGSGPHNVLIRHNDVGVISLYGHLLGRAPVQPGQYVNQGDVIGYSGDPDITCDSRPHLHLEIRSLDYFVAYNPVDYIDANWHTLSLVGQFRYPAFQQDLDHARQWMSIDDQPFVAFGGRALNAYAATYPDWAAGSPPANPPSEREAVPLIDGAWTEQRLTLDGCCANAWWHPTEPTQLFVIDGSENQRAAVFQWDTQTGSLVNLIGQAPQPIESPDGTHTISRYGDGFLIQRKHDGFVWEVSTGGAFPALSADNSHLLWVNQGQVIAPGQTEPTNEIWISDADGAGARMIAAEAGLNAQWLDDSRFLLSRRVGVTTTLGIYEADTGNAFVVGAWDRLRGLTVSPGGDRLMFYLFAQTEPALSGVYAVETVQGATAVQQDWFGAWRWRDSHSVFYIPFDPASDRQVIRYRDLLTGEDRQITGLPIAVADGDWSVSADGGRIAYLNLLDRTIWVLSPNPPQT